MQIASSQNIDQNLQGNLGMDVGESSLAASKQISSSLRKLMARKASKRSLLIAFRQLALLVETGIDVTEAIELVASTCRQTLLQDALEEIYDDINNGNSLSAAVAAQEAVLGHEIVASIHAGEASGKLVDVLRQIADQLEEQLQVRSTIIGALAYPAILCAASIAVAAILVWFVLPQFEQSFASMGVDPPTLTQVILDGAAFLRNNLLALAIGAPIAMVAIALLLIQPRTREIITTICFHSPLIGLALRNLSVGRLFMSLGHLLGNGISLLEAIQLVRRSSLNGSIQRLTTMWEEEVIEGRGLTGRLDEFTFLPEGADAMLVMAEKTGKLETVLSTAGAFYRDEGSGQLKTFLKLSEPLIIIVLGAFVGTVVASVLLPILDVQSAGSAG